MLARLRSEGIPFVMVTGRPRRWLAPVIEQTGACGPVVCANGALVIEPTSGEVLAEWTIPAAAIAEATRRAREVVPGLGLAFAIERGPMMLHEEHYPVRWDLGLAEERIAPYEEIVAGEATKLLIRTVEGDQPSCSTSSPRSWVTP